MSGKPAAKRPAPQYVVTGIHPVHGHKPGEKFMAHLTIEQEAALIEGRAIARVPDDAPRRVSGVAGARAAADTLRRLTLADLDAKDEA